MDRRKQKLKLIIVAAIMFASCSEAVQASNWGDVKSPSSGAAKIYGGYTAGCVAGAKELAKTGAGYELVRVERNRFFGHPEMINYLENLGAAVKKIGGEIQISDMSQPRGGPMVSGHGSHQIGLDADIWFGKIGVGEDAMPVELADPEKNELIESEWRPYYAKLLEVAATPKEVGRIFVHPTIKRKLCQTQKGKPWLYKIRPWWGHHDHLHVRLNCPEGDNGCKPQEPLSASSNGCDESLVWWFSEEAHEEFLKRKEAKKGTPTPVLPDECAKLLEE